MDTEKYLELAYIKWGNDDSLIAKRNLAFAEVYAATGSFDLSYRLTWNNVYFTESPYIRWNEKYPITQYCADALMAWLEGLWVLYSQSGGAMNSPVFNHALKHTELDNDADDQLRQLTLRFEDALKITQLHLEILAQERKQFREAKRTKVNEQQKLKRLLSHNKLPQDLSLGEAESEDNHLLSIELKQLRQQNKEESRQQKVLRAADSLYNSISSFMEAKSYYRGKDRRRAIQMIQRGGLHGEKIT